MNFKIMQELLDELNKKPRGMTIKNLMEITGHARGTVKTHLDILTYTSQVDEVKYLQNVKVYFANVEKVKSKIASEHGVVSVNHLEKDSLKKLPPSEKARGEDE